MLSLDIDGLIVFRKFCGWRTVDLNLKQFIVLMLLWDNGTMTQDELLEHMDYRDVDKFRRLVRQLCFKRQFGGTSKPCLELVNYQAEGQTFTLSRDGKEMVGGIFGVKKRTRTA